MKILARQALTASSAVVLGLGLQSRAMIRAIALIKNDGTDTDAKIYMPYRSEAVGTANRIFESTIGDGTVAIEFDPPLEKPPDAALYALASTTTTITVYGD